MARSSQVATRLPDPLSISFSHSTKRIKFRCTKNQIIVLKKNQSKYSLNSSYIVLKIRSLQKLKTMFETRCIIGIFFFQISDLTLVSSEFNPLQPNVHGVKFSLREIQKDFSH